MSACDAPKAPANCLTNLQYVLHHNIENPTSKYVGTGLLNAWSAANGQAPKTYPGAIFALSGGPQGFSLLGTPNRYGVGWMLSQHVAGLGHKVVTMVEDFMAEERFQGYSGDYLRFGFAIQNRP